MVKTSLDQQFHFLERMENENVIRKTLLEVCIEIQSPEIDLEELMTLEGFTIRYYNTDKSSVYIGQLATPEDSPSKIVRPGVGVIRYENGRRQYEGEWFNDLREGRGFERYSNNNSYFGGFSQGKAHGHGVWKSADGGDSYIGEWRHSKAEGYGLHVWRNGDRYEGEWKQCLKHGNGLDTFGNGDTYQGEFQNGKSQGRGSYNWA